MTRRPILPALLLAGALGLLVFRLPLEPGAAAHAGEDGTPAYSPYVDAAGNISLPRDYQTRFTHLGTFVVSEPGGGPPVEFHGVYARPSDVSAYRRDGKFPDGAVIVKDVYRADRGKLTTGAAAWATEPKQWFVMVKDARGRFAKNPLWGNGWGWALFKADDPQRQVATDYRVDCRTCHLPARKDDWLFVRGYPVLHDADGVGK